MIFHRSFFQFSAEDGVLENAHITAFNPHDDLALAKTRKLGGPLRIQEKDSSKRSQRLRNSSQILFIFGLVNVGRKFAASKFLLRTWSVARVVCTSDCT